MQRSKRGLFASFVFVWANLVLHSVPAHAGAEGPRACGLSGSLEERLQDCAASIEGRGDEPEPWKLVSYSPEIPGSKLKKVQLWLDPDHLTVNEEVNDYYLVAQWDEAFIRTNKQVQDFCKDVASYLPLDGLGIERFIHVATEMQIQPPGRFPVEKALAMEGVQSGVVLLEEGYDTSSIQKCPYGEAKERGKWCSWVNETVYDGIDSYVVCQGHGSVGIDLKWEALKADVLRTVGRLK